MKELIQVQRRSSKLGVLWDARCCTFCSWRWFWWNVATSRTSCGRWKSPSRGLTVCLKNTSTRFNICLYVDRSVRQSADNHFCVWFNGLIRRGIVSCSANCFAYSYTCLISVVCLSVVCHFLAHCPFNGYRCRKLWFLLALSYH